MWSTEIIIKCVLVQTLQTKTINSRGIQTVSKTGFGSVRSSFMSWLFQSTLPGLMFGLKASSSPHPLLWHCCLTSLLLVQWIIPTSFLYLLSFISCWRKDSRFTKPVWTLQVWTLIWTCSLFVNPIHLDLSASKINVYIIHKNMRNSHSWTAVPWMGCTSKEAWSGSSLLGLVCSCFLIRVKAHCSRL